MIFHSDFYSQRHRENREALQCVADGAELITSNGRKFKGIKTLNGSQLEAGMKVLAAYAQYNNGADIIEILGLTGWWQQYGEGGVTFTSVKELMTAEGVKSLKALEAKQDEREYGYQSYMVARDIGSGDKPTEGPWYYQFEGRWSRGSGAETLSFVLLEGIGDAKAA